MNEGLNLIKLLEGCSEGTKLYLSVIDREVSLQWVSVDREYPIRVIDEKSGVHFDIMKGGYLYKDFPDGEIVLFPSKDQRDWSKFGVFVEKFDYSILKPFDKVLVGDFNDQPWRCQFLSYKTSEVAFCTGVSTWYQMIPFNDDTKHLVGTNDMPDEKYVWWK